MIKRLTGKVIDNGRAILQMLLLVICFCFPKLVNLSEIIRTLLGGQSPDFSTAKYVGYPCFILFVFFSIYRLKRVRRNYYVCGKCGKRIEGKGECPYCGAINE